MQCRLSHFLAKMHGFREAQEAAYRRHADLVRLQTVELINIQLSKNKIKKACELWKFPWDALPDNAPRVTPEQAAENLNRLLQALQSNEQHPIHTQG